jgi:microcystin-dependent protein
MVTSIKNWSTTAGSNNSAAPNGAPEGMAPSGVNDTIRQIMAEVREWYETMEWIDYGHSGLTYVDTTNFRVTGDQTAIYAVNRRVRAIGTTPFTLYGRITASVFSSPNTTVTVEWDSTAMDNTLSEVAVGVQVTNKPVAADGVHFDNTVSGLTAANVKAAIDEVEARVQVVEGLDTFPAGSLMPYAGASAPSKWLLCFGQAVSRTTYASLFTAISTTYGVGDGSTTFNLPDLRGRVIAGQDDMGGTSANRLTGLTDGVDGDVLGGTGGAESHTLTVAQTPALNCSADATIFAAAAGAQTVIRGLSPNASGTHYLTTNGGGQAHNNVQPTIVLNYIIYTGVA